MKKIYLSLTAILSVLLLSGCNDKIEVTVPEQSKQTSNIVSNITSNYTSNSTSYSNINSNYTSNSTGYSNYNSNYTSNSNIKSNVTSNIVNRSNTNQSGNTKILNCSIKQSSNNINFTLQENLTFSNNKLTKYKAKVTYYLPQSMASKADTIIPAMVNAFKSNYPNSKYIKFTTKKISNTQFYILLDADPTKLTAQQRAPIGMADYSYDVYKTAYQKNGYTCK